MRVHVLARSQVIPTDLAAAWDFFSSPRNLDRITPPDVQFRMTSEWPDRLAEGQVMTYRVTPLLRLPWTWVTVITTVREPTYFEDLMRTGPYRLWRHEHTFTEVPGGVRIDDQVHYALPADPLSRPLHALLVRPKIEAIFDFRRDTIREIFGPPPGMSDSALQAE
jgi:ligand-binding SRPBCC domain-containing protein